MNLRTAIKKTAATAIITSLVASSLVGCSESTKNADLDRVLDITSDTLYSFETSHLNTQDDAAIVAFASELETNLNLASPAVHPGPIGINLKEEGSFQGYHDKDGNQVQDSGEPEIFIVEIDGEGERLLASDSTATRDHGFSGTSLLAGFLIGSMLSRQSKAGVSKSSLSSKTSTPKSSYQSSRSKSGSGSHATGK
jgi:hypothetical protein